MAASFEREGAKVTTSVFCNLTAEDIEKSTSDIASHIDACDILAFSGGFSEGSICSARRQQVYCQRDYERKGESRH